MAKAKFEIAGIDIRGEAAKGLHAGVGVADRAIEAVREYVSEAQKQAQKALTSAQKSVKDFDFQPKALRTQAATVFTATVGELSQDAKARREAIEKRVVELQGEATDTFGDLVKRGEVVVNRFRKQTAAVADPGPVKKSTGVTTTAKKAPARKTTATKAPARKTTAKKAPAKKAAGK